jgi:hypothetical protein
VALAGCRAKGKAREDTLYERIRHGEWSSPARAVPGKMAAVGRDAITSECAHESYANASKGLIVEEAGLHEDVFALRDRDSLRANAYDLDEALRLETMLDEETKAPGHSEEQVICIDQFAVHLGELTDALTQADKVQKEIDLSVFNETDKRDKDQTDQMEKKLEEMNQGTGPGKR